MRKIILSIALMFAASGAQAALLESSATPLNPEVGSKSRFTKVYASGEVHKVYCDITTGVCDTTLVAQMSPYAINHIYGLIQSARFGTVLPQEPLCTAVPTESRSYTADGATVTLENGTYPCGAFNLNTSDAADALLGILKQYD